MPPYQSRLLLVSCLVCLQFVVNVGRSPGESRSDKSFFSSSESILLAQETAASPSPPKELDSAKSSQVITQLGAVVGEQFRQEEIALVAQEKAGSPAKTGSAGSPGPSKKLWLLAGGALVAVSSMGAILLRFSRRPQAKALTPEPTATKESRSAPSQGYRISLPALGETPPTSEVPPLPSDSSPEENQDEKNHAQESNGQGRNGHQSEIIVHPQPPASDSSRAMTDDLAVGEMSFPVKTPSETAANSHELAIGETTRIAKPTIVEELVRELQSVDRTRRSRAIWELGQRGDSHAVQPLVDLLLDSDSKQRSLILASLSEIGVRTLKPLNRALTIGLQDENAEVRKNAIRDLTRVYDLIGQITQLLRHAAQDPDPEVQETARWALNQVGRLRTAAGMESSPSNQPSISGGPD
ncbi:MAG: HEAT repeat domain-containing protein [Leptolyngbyaceae cyanobacterium bins.59]|nr:HEAT repeat domain-containing protein [Leptolyngbyaceae cyanobacterium bins.59]